MPVDTDEDRGKFLLTAHGQVVNNGAIKVEETFRDLLESGAWRSYTFPDGTHHEWLEREFDYFVSSWLASQGDQRWELVKRNLVSRDVTMMLADHSGGPERQDERRSIDRVRDQLPGVKVEPIQLVSARERTIALDDDKRREYIGDETIPAERLVRPAGRKWTVHYNASADGSSNVGDLAAAVVAKLEQEPDLAKAVHNRLDSRLRPRANRRRNGR
jgi:hypothetical protein